MWKWIKVPKGIALLAFLAPWMTVSCQGQPFARAAGWQLVLGRSSPVVSPSTTGGAPVPASNAELNMWLILALAVIVVGLVIACLKYSKQMSLAVLGTSVVSVVLIWLGTMMKYSPAELMKDMSKGGGADSPGMDPATLQGMIQINWEWGFWLALIALVAAGVMAFLAYSGKDAALGGSAAPDEPPAS